MRIKSLEVENFKLFTDKFNEISNISKSDLIILNGPNGYGKTSIFDAIEFALTGKIKRINKYNENLGVKKNIAYDKKILISDETKEAYINLCLEDDEENNIKIQRMYTPAKNQKNKSSKDNNPYRIFERFDIKLFINQQQIIGHENIMEEMKKYNLNEIEDFYDKCCFLSQDEHLQFLKETNADKASALEFLFEIPNEQQKEIDRVNRLISSLENNNKFNNLGYITKLTNKVEKDIKPKIQNIEATLEKSDTRGVEKPKYKCLFPSKSIYWDKESLRINTDEYDEAINEIGKLLYFSENKNSCLNFLYNRPLKKIIQPFSGNENDITKNNQLEYTYRYYYLVKNEKAIDLKYTLQQKYENLKDLIEKRELYNINWNFITEERLLDEIQIENIKEKLNEVKEIEKTQETISKVITNITKTRNTLIDYASNAMDEFIMDDKTCPLCGRLFENRDKLEKEIKKETDILQDLSDESSIKIENIIKSLYNHYFNDLLNNILKKLKDPIQKNIYNKLQEVKKNKGIINEIVELLKSIDIEIPDKYEMDIVEIEHGYNNLVKKISGKFKEVPTDIELQLEVKDFIHEYEKYYEENEEEFNKITSNMLSVKEHYVKMSFYNTEMKELNVKKAELTIIENRIKKLNEILAKLQNYRDTIQRGVDLYKRKIIQDIEPILYVYTAKILQQKFNGKSIFISCDDEMKNIQFINSVGDNQDILYTMSSGQLASISLAFLLCMNQVYAKQALPILLIDDPIQTIDDVNMVGLVDILRYEFIDRQIFISTHEKKFELYLRYKYEKANKFIKPFNMKNLTLQ